MIKSFSQELQHYLYQQSIRYSGLKILDLGCGKGDYTYLFGRKNKVIGIDLQKVVQKKYKNFIFKKADATNLPFRMNYFDMVISFDVIEHIKNDKQFVREAFRVLKYGGKILFGTPNKNRIVNRILCFIGQPRHYPYFLGVDPDLGIISHIREYNHQELYELIYKNNFKHIKVTPFWFGLTFLPFGLKFIPKPLQQFSQYLFIEATK